MRKAKKRGTVETQGEFGTKTTCRADMAGAASTERQEMEAVSDCCTKELLLLPYPYFQLPPACSGTTLRVSMGMEKANETQWSCWKSSLCLPCLHLEPALHKLYVRQEGWLFPHTSISGREGCSTLVPVPTKPPWSTYGRARSMSPRSPRYSIPQPGCLPIATLFSQKPPRSWLTGKSVSCCSPGLNFERWTRGSISYYESPMLSSPIDYSIIAFLVKYRFTFWYCAWWKFSWFSGIHYKLGPLEAYWKAGNNRKSLPTVTLDLSSDGEYYVKTFKRWNIYLPNWQNKQNNTSSCLTSSQVSPYTI